MWLELLHWGLWSIHCSPERNPPQSDWEWQIQHLWRETHDNTQNHSTLSEKWSAGDTFSFTEQTRVLTVRESCSPLRKSLHQKPETQKHTITPTQIWNLTQIYKMFVWSWECQGFLQSALTLQLWPAWVGRSSHAVEELSWSSPCPRLPVRRSIFH